MIAVPIGWMVWGHITTYARASQGSTSSAPSINEATDPYIFLRQSSYWNIHYRSVGGSSGLPMGSTHLGYSVVVIIVDLGIVVVEPETVVAGH